MKSHKLISRLDKTQVALRLECREAEADALTEAVATILHLWDVLERINETPKGYQDICWKLASDALSGLQHEQETKQGNR